MEDLTNIIKEIVERCATGKVAVSQVLAAFVVRTVSAGPGSKRSSWRSVREGVLHGLQRLPYTQKSECLYCRSHRVGVCAFWM